MGGGLNVRNVDDTNNSEIERMASTFQIDFANLAVLISQKSSNDESFETEFRV